MDAGVIVNSVAAVVALTALGAWLRSRNFLTAEADATLLRLIVNVLAPALILHTIVGNARLNSASNLLIPPLLGFGTVSVGFGVAAVVARFLRLDAPARRTFAVSVGIYNYAYIPLPLVAGLFDVNSTTKGTLGVLLVSNIGVELAMWTLGVTILRGGLSRESLAKLVNPPLIAIVCAVIVNASGLSRYWPGALVLSTDMLGRMLIPLSLLLTGALIRDAWSTSRLLGGVDVIIAASLLRLLALPTMMVALAVYLPLSVEMRRVLIVQAAMPAAVFPIVLARLYGGHPPTAVRVCIGTSLLGLVTLPLWLRLGLRWIS